MPVKVRLSEGVEIVVNAELSDLMEALEAALANGELLSITNPDGDDVVINPRHVLYLSNGTTAHLSGESARQVVEPVP